MNEFPILLLDNFFLFPKCDSHLSLESNIYWKKVLLQAWKDSQGYLLIIPNKEKFGDDSEKDQGGLVHLTVEQPHSWEAERGPVESCPILSFHEWSPSAEVVIGVVFNESCNLVPG